MLMTNRLAIYLFKIQQMVSKGQYVNALMVCPECRQDAEDIRHDADHIVIGQKIEAETLYYVIIGCEGYWTVDPKKVGLKRGNWEPVYEVIKKNLDYYIREPKTYAPAFDEVTEDNKADIAKVINRDGRLNPGEKADLLQQLDQ
jgi:hypothetical protein